MIKNNFFTALMFTTAMTTSAFCMDEDVTVQHEPTTTNTREIAIKEDDGTRSRSGSLSSTSSFGDDYEENGEDISKSTPNLEANLEATKVGADEDDTEEKTASELAMTVLYEQLADIIQENVTRYATIGFNIPEDSKTVAQKLSAMLNYCFDIDKDYNALADKNNLVTIENSLIKRDAGILSQEIAGLKQEVAELTESKKKYKRIAAELKKKSSATVSKETVLKAAVEEKDVSTANTTEKSVGESVDAPLPNMQLVEEVAESKTKYAFLGGDEFELYASEARAIRDNIIGGVTGVKAKIFTSGKSNEALFATLSLEVAKSLLS